jgi:hypothetical protein
MRKFGSLLELLLLFRRGVRPEGNRDRRLARPNPLWSEVAVESVLQVAGGTSPG